MARARWRLRRSTCRNDTFAAPEPGPVLLLILAALAVSVCVGLPTASLAQLSSPTFVDLEPILRDRCVVCHAGTSPAAGLRLDSLDGLKAGSRNGSVAKAGDPAGSEIVRRLKGIATPRMPLTGPPFLSDAEIGVFERWIADGMPEGQQASAVVPLVVPTARPRAPGQRVTYSDVAPIFATRCASCHAEKGRMGPAPEGYRLTSYGATVSTADRARVVPGVPLASELYRRIRGFARPRMPLDGPPYLSDDDVALIEAWIRDGARDSNGQVAALPIGSRIRLNGTLGADWSLDGLSLNVTGATRIDKSPQPGDSVEVRGSVRTDGRIAVERLRRR